MRRSTSVNDHNQVTDNLFVQKNIVFHFLGLTLWNTSNACNLWALIALHPKRELVKFTSENKVELKFPLTKQSLPFFEVSTFSSVLIYSPKCCVKFSTNKIPDTITHKFRRAICKQIGIHADLLLGHYYHMQKDIQLVEFNPYRFSQMLFPISD